MSPRSSRTPALNWTVADIPDLAGRTAVVTGAASGLGLAVTRELAARGALVVLAARDTAKAERVRARLPRGAGQALVLELDLFDLASVHRFADALHDRLPSLDLLVANAAASNQPARLSAEGVEVQFATNHLGHFALTGRLSELLERGRDPRVVSVVSALYPRGTLELERLGATAGYSPGRAYIRSKLANVLFARELQRRLHASGSPVRSFAAHPGMARTPLHDTYPSPVVRALTRTVAALIGREPEHAAAPILYAATAPDASPATVYGPTGPKAHPRIRPEPFTGPGADDDAARALWAASERLTGLALPSR
ncbi:SDR family NAD(P)-dependent oxidoreductase [Kitasatospora sp. NPDC049285]|uniref:SDR family NAD(P)-dependent oxidoreductase n=1 Tax=Kitasatospora sp. NPDC049285 TaxID=3157096 RepID=UPI003425229D